MAVSLASLGPGTKADYAWVLKFTSPKHLITTPQLKPFINRTISGLFLSYFRLFSTTVDGKQKLLTIGFEPCISVVRSDHSTSCTKPLFTSDCWVLRRHVRDNRWASQPDGLVNGGRNPDQVFLVAQRSGRTLPPDVLINFGLDQD